MARGRVGLVELAQMLSLDFSHIETQVGYDLLIISFKRNVCIKILL